MVLDELIDFLFTTTVWLIDTFVDNYSQIFSFARLKCSLDVERRFVIDAVHIGQAWSDACLSVKIWVAVYIESWHVTFCASSEINRQTIVQIFKNINRYLRHIIEFNIPLDHVDIELEEAFHINEVGSIISVPYQLKGEIKVWISLIEEFRRVTKRFMDKRIMIIFVIDENLKTLRRVSQ